MGLQVANGEVDPTISNFPLGTPDELEKHGYDVAQVHSCAIPVIVNGVPQIKGCFLAQKCRKLFGKKGLRFGGFGPTNGKPGTPGQGREYVPYSIEFPDGGFKEDFTWCYAFVGSSLYDWLVNQNSPEYTGPKVRLLGKAGEGGSTGLGADIVVVDAVAEDPNNNRTKNYRITQTEKVVTVLKAPRFGAVVTGIRSRRSAEEADETEFLAGLAGTSVAGRDSEGFVGADAPDEPVEAVAAVEGEKKHRGRPRKTIIGGDDE
jgi:hypothetical protein